MAKPKKEKKSELAKAVKKAILGKDVGMGMSTEEATKLNVEFATTTAQKMGATLEQFAAEDALSESDKDIFSKMLSTLQGIATSTKDTSKERQQIENLLAKLVAKTELDIKDLQDELKIKEEALKEALKRETVTDEEIKVRTEEILELKKEVSKKEDVAAKTRELATERKVTTPQELVKKDVMTILGKYLPGTTFEQKEGEGFTEMIGRTFKETIAEGPQGILNAILGKKPSEPSFEEMVKGQKTAESLGGLKESTLTGIFTKMEGLLTRSVEIQEEQLELIKEVDEETDRDQAEVTPSEQLDLFAADDQLDLFNAPRDVPIKGDIETNAVLTPSAVDSQQMEMLFDQKEEKEKGSGVASSIGSLLTDMVMKKFIPGMAGGGEVQGTGTPTGDNVLTRLSPGEFVMNAAATRGLGVGTLETMNRTGAVVDNVTEQAMNPPAPPATPSVINNITTPGEAPRGRSMELPSATVRTSENSFIRFQNKRFVHI